MMAYQTQKKIDWLFVLPSDYLGGGAEQLQFNMVEYLERTGNTCCIIFLKKGIGTNWKDNGLRSEMRYMPFQNVYLSYVFCFFYLMRLSSKRQIVHTFSSQTLINGLLGFMKRLGFFKKSKVIVRESNSIFNLLKGFKLKLYALAYKLGYRSVDLLICQTEYMRDRLVGSVPWISKKLKVVVIANPINLENAGLKGEEPLENKSKYGDYLVAAGRLVPAKGFDILIDAFKEVSHLHPNLNLLILGEGKERNHLEKMISELRLEEKIHLVGFVSNVYPFFRHAKACVLSSRIEGFPNVLLQMMTQNNRIVATLSAGGISEIKGLFTCKPDDRPSLVKAMNKSLNTDVESNRNLFDKELSKRTMKSFVDSISGTKSKNEVISIK